MQDWQDFEALEGPFGDRRTDFNAAQIALTTAASAGAFEDDDVPPLEKFMIRYGPEVDDVPSLENEDGGGGGYSWMQD